MRSPLLLALVVIAACRSGDPTPPPRASVAQSRDLALTHATVVPMTAVEVLHDQTILIRGDRIVTVAPSSEVQLPPDVQGIDATGMFVMPGLADMHVHTFNDEDMAMFVAAGVTTIRNMFGFPVHLEIRDKITRGTLVGPTLVTAGAIVDGEPPIWPDSDTVESVDDANRVVAAQKAAGFDFIKVYSLLTPDAYDAVVAAAKREHMTFAGHVPWRVPLAHALEAGQRSIEHLEGYVTALRKDSTPRSTATTWGQMIAYGVANADETKLPAVVAMTMQSGTWNCPTLVVMERMSRMANPESVAKTTRWLEYVRPDLRTAWDPKNDFRIAAMTADDFAAMRDENPLKARIVRALAAAGANLLVGTDTGNPFVVPGAALHDEIELLVAAGISRATVLRAATAGAAQFLDRPTDGVIAVGARADLILSATDPLAGAIAIPPAGVVLRGRWLDHEALQAGLDKIKN